MKLLDELKRITDRFNAGGIDYALCGGLAMAVYAMPRATLDINLLIETAALDRVRGAAGDLGFTISGIPMEFKGGEVQIHRLSKMDPLTHELMVLDLMLVTSATRPAWESRRHMEWEGGSLSIVSPEGLMALKSLRNSGQDLTDIAYLKSLSYEN